MEIEATRTTLTISGNPDGGFITAFDVPTLQSHGNYVLVLAGAQGVSASDPTGLLLLGAGADGTVFQADPLPTLVAFHAIADTAGIDVFRKGKKVVDNLGYGQTAPAFFFPTDGGSELDVILHQDGGHLAKVTAAGQAVRTRSLGVVWGAAWSTASAPVSLSVLEEGFTVPTGTQATLRVVNAIPDAPSVDFGTVTGTTLSTLAGFTAIASGAASDLIGAVQPVANTQFGVAKAKSTSPLVSRAFNVPAGSEGFLIALGFATPSAGAQPVTLIRVDVPLAVGVPWVATPGAK